MSNTLKIWQPVFWLIWHSALFFIVPYASRFPIQVLLTQIFLGSLQVKFLQVDWIKVNNDHHQLSLDVMCMNFSHGWQFHSGLEWLRPQLQEQQYSRPRHDFLIGSLWFTSCGRISFFIPKEQRGVFLCLLLRAQSPRKCLYLPNPFFVLLGYSNE